MCYLIAKKFDKPGCIAVQAERGKQLAQLVTDLGWKLLDKGVQILTVTDPKIYGEYKPYTFLSSQEEFIQKAMKM